MAIYYKYEAGFDPTPDYVRVYKYENDRAYVWLNGEWRESEGAFARITGIGGDASTHPISDAEAEAILKEQGWTG